MVGPCATMIAYCCERQCCCCPPGSRTRVHVGSPSPRIIEGMPGRRGRAGLVALALVALTLAAIVRGTR
jgi:hypothetical protein